jgi:coproporphyrinogen III oxidase-like Fe-S oxidoreductase
VTIYNFSSTAKSAIKVYKSGKTNITNSIVANPAESDHYSFMIYEGAKVQNCLNFNSVGQWASNAYTDTICADPLFVDAANNNFKLKGNSPAIDEAIDMHQPIEEFLTQEEYEPSSMKETLDKLASLSGVEIPESEYVEAPA